MSVLTERIENELAPVVLEAGYEIVRTMLTGTGGKKTLQIMIERIDGESITIEDCEKASRIISVRLDVSDPITGHYNLEVSSTGIDRPLVKPSDFIKFRGSPVVVKTYVLKNGKKIFKGILESASENGINLALDAPVLDGESGLDLLYEEISSAHIDGLKI